jgi:hypothetical protein
VTRRPTTEIFRENRQKNNSACSIERTLDAK